MKIKAKLILGSGLLLCITILSLLGFAANTISSYLEEDARMRVEKNLDGFRGMLEIYQKQALGHSLTLSQYPGLVELVLARDFDALLKLTQPYMNKNNLEFIVITDNKGDAIIRTHEPDKRPKPGDNIANQTTIVGALAGKPSVEIEAGKVVRLCRSHDEYIGCGGRDDGGVNRPARCSREI